MQQQKRLETSLLGLVPIEEVSLRNRTTRVVIQPFQVTLQPISLVAAPATRATITCTVDQGLRDQWLPTMGMSLEVMPTNSLSEDP